MRLPNGRISLGSGRARVARLLGSQGCGRGLACCEPLEGRTLLAAIAWDGGGDGTSWHDLNNWNPNQVPTVIDDATISVAGTPTITYSATTGTRSVNSLVCDETINFTGGNLTVVTTATLQGGAVATVNGGTLTGGTWDVTAGQLNGSTSSSSTLDGVTVQGDVRLGGAGNAFMRFINGSSFTNIRFNSTGTGTSVAGFSPGSTITGNILVENTNSGGLIQVGMTAAGTLTIGSGAQVRVMPGAASGITFPSTATGFTGAMTLVNDGLVSNEAASRTLTLGGTLTSFSNSATGTLRVTTGTLTIAAPSWTSAGATDVQGGTLNLGGTWNATSGIGTWTRSGGTVNITGTMNNAGNSVTLDASTGEWILAGGTISGGTLTTTPGNLLRATNSTSNLITGLAVNGNITLSAVGARLKIEGGSTFAFLSMSGSGAAVGFAPGSVITGNIVFSASSGTALFVDMNGTAGTLTIAPTGSITTSGGLAVDGFVGNQGAFSGAMTLINNGLIHSSTSARAIQLPAASFTNTGTLQVSGGASLLVTSAAWTTSAGSIVVVSGTFGLSGTLSTTGGIGTWNRTGGTVLVSGTINNTGSSFTLDATTGSWVMANGTITGGTINLPGSQSIGHNTGTSSNTLDGVTVVGDLVLANGTGGLRIIGGTTFTNARLQGDASGLGFAPGSVLNGNVIFEGAGTNQYVDMTATGTLTIGPSGSIRSLTAGATFFRIGSGGLYPGVMTLTNQGLMAVGTAGRTMLITASSFTNASSGTLQTTAATAVVTVNATNWENDGSVQANGGRVDFGGTYAANTSSGTIGLSAGTVRFTSTVTNTASTVAFVNGSTGTVELQGVTFNGGNLDILAGLTTSITSVATFNGGATINGDLAFPSLGSQLRVSGGLTFNGTATFVGAGCSIVFNGGTQSLAGSATLIMSTGGSPDEISAAAGAVVTIAPGVTIRGTGRLTAGLTFGGTGSFVNQGTIDADSAGGGVLSIRSGITSFTNSGLMRATGGGNLEIAANMTTAQFGDVRNVSGTVTLAGTLTNTAATLAMNATTGSYTLQGGLISGGIVSATGGSKLIVGSGTTNRLSGVTMNGDLDFVTVAFPVLQVLNGLTFNGAAVLTGAGATIAFNGGVQTLGGNANITMVTGGSPDYITADAGAIVTIGPAVMISGVGRLDSGAVFGGAGSFINQGTIDATTAGTIELRSTLTAFTNQGTMRSSGGGLLLFSGGASSFTNLNGGTLTGGAYEIVGSSTLTTPAAAGSITSLAAGTTVRLDGAGSIWAALSTLATNSGSLTFANGRAFNFTPAGNLFTNSGSLIKSGTGTSTIAGSITLDNSGTVDSQGGSFVVGGPVSQVIGGALSGGTWLVSTGAVLDLTAANITTNNTVVTLSGTADFIGLQNLATNNGTLTLTSGYAWDFTPAGGVFTNPGDFFVTGGGTLTVPGTVAFNNQGNSVHISGNSTLVFQGGGTNVGDFDVAAGSAVVFGGGNYSFSATTMFYGGGSVTFAAGINTVSGPVQTTGTLTISGGTTIFDGAVGDQAGLRPASVVITGGSAVFNGALADANAELPVSILPAGAASFGGAAFAGVLSNAGTLNISAGLLTTTVDFDNAGLVTLTGGSAEFRAGLGQSGLHTGDFQISAGRRATFAGDHQFQASSDLTGAGGASFVLGASTLFGTVNLSGITNFHASAAGLPTQVTFNNSVQLGTAVLAVLSPAVFDGGSVTFNSTTTIASLQRWQGTPRPTLSVGSGAAVTVSGGMTGFLSGSFDAQINVTGGSFMGYGGGDHGGTDFALATGGQVSLNGLHILGGDNDFAGSGVVHNLGQMRREEAGLTDFEPGVTLDNPGMIDVLAGQVRARGPVEQITGGVLAAGTWCGTDPGTISMPGQVITGNNGWIMLSGPGALFEEINGLTSNGGTLAFIDGRNFAAQGAFSNSGMLTVGTGSVFSAAAGTLNNSGLVTVAGATLSATAGGLHSGDFVLMNAGELLFGGDHTFTSTSDITGDGNITFSSGTSTLGGTINITGTITFTGNNETFNGPVTAGGISINSVSTVTFNGPTTTGTLQLSGTLAGTGDLTATGAFTWSGGSLLGSGRLTAAGGLSGPLSGSLSLARPMDLSGTVEVTGTLTLLDATLRLAGATLNVPVGGAIVASGAGGIQSLSGTNLVWVAGSLTKTGAGTMVVSAPFSGPGSVSVQQGGLTFDGGVSQVSGASLTGGTWSVSDAATLTFSGAFIEVNDASILLSGPASAFAALDTLTTNNGSLTITDGRVLTLPSLVNNGTLTVGPGSGLAVTGTLSLTTGSTTFDVAPAAAVLSIGPAATAIFNVDLAGSVVSISNAGVLALGTHTLSLPGTYTQAPTGSLTATLAAAASGRVAAAGVATLDGSLTASLASGYTPARGARFDLVTGASRAGTFSAVSTPTPPVGSASRWLTVYPAAGMQLLYTSTADWNADGLITPADIGTFVTDWSASLSQSTLLADFDGNGAVNNQDIAIFVSTWFGAL